MEKMRLLNTYVNNVTLDEAVEFLLQKIREQTPAYVVEVNVDVVVKMETDLVLRQITDNADLTLVDGPAAHLDLEAVWPTTEDESVRL